MTVDVVGQILQTARSVSRTLTKLLLREMKVDRITPKTKQRTISVHEPWCVHTSAQVSNPPPFIKYRASYMTQQSGQAFPGKSNRMTWSKSPRITAWTQAKFSPGRYRFSCLTPSLL